MLTDAEIVEKTNLEQPQATGSALLNLAKASRAAFGGRPYLWVTGNALIVSLWIWAAFLKDSRAVSGGRVLLALLATLMVLSFLGLYRVIVTVAEYCIHLDRREILQRVALCFNAGVIFLLFLPEYLLGHQVPVVRSLVLLVSAGLLFMIWIGLSLRPESKATVDSGVRPKMILAAFTLAYFALCAYLDIRKFNCFGYIGQDLAYITQCFYTTLHGYLFYGNVIQDAYYTHSVMSDFAGHNSVIMFFLLPVYGLFQSPITLLLIRSALMASCAWPVYLLARRRLSSAVSAVLAISFLLLPTIFYASLDVPYILSLAAFFLLFAFHFYFQDRFLPFLVFSVLSLFVREDLVFAIFGFGLLALWHRRGTKWAAVPMGLATFWAILSWIIVLPHFMHGAKFVVGLCFTNLGSTRAEMIRNVLTHPVEMLVTRTNLTYLKQLITPMGCVLFLASPVAALALPYIGIDLLGGAGPCCTTLIVSHYMVLPAVILFVAFVASLGEVGLWLAKIGIDPRRFYRAMAPLILFLTLATIAFSIGERQISEFRPQPWNNEARRVAHLIPKQASVAAPRYMLPLLANRLYLFQTHLLFRYHHPNPEYVIMDRGSDSELDGSGTNLDEREATRALRDELTTSRQFELIYRSANFLIFRNLSSPPTPISRPAGAP
ncbi:MAG TPA: DUF2079 domain-containing protein [Terriglobia bacterium]|nr:DUF2079 domain-containing protein [Terriglobia bacterium]